MVWSLSHLACSSTRNQMRRNQRHQRRKRKRLASLTCYFMLKQALLAVLQRKPRLKRKQLLRLRLHPRSQPSELPGRPVLSPSLKVMGRSALDFAPTRGATGTRAAYVYSSFGAQQLLIRQYRASKAHKKMTIELSEDR